MWPNKDPESYSQMDDDSEDGANALGNDQSGGFFPKSFDDSSSDGMNEGEAANGLITGSLAIVDPPRRNSAGIASAEFDAAVLRNDEDREIM